jgi:hypothetical protein
VAGLAHQPILPLDQLCFSHGWLCRCSIAVPHPSVGPAVQVFHAYAEDQRDLQLATATVARAAAGAGLASAIMMAGGQVQSQVQGRRVTLPPPLTSQLSMSFVRYLQLCQVRASGLGKAHWIVFGFSGYDSPVLLGVRAYHPLTGRSPTAARGPWLHME